MRKSFVAASLSFALLAACSTMNGVAGGPSGIADMTPEERGAYVTMAAASDLFEIQTGQLASQRARRPQVRQFG